MNSELTLRDRFAIAALRGLVADPGYLINTPEAAQDAARNAYMVADAMLAERDRGNEVEFVAPREDEDIVDPNWSDEDIAKQKQEHAELLARPVSDPEKFTRCMDCGEEMPRWTGSKDGELGICDKDFPF